MNLSKNENAQGATEYLLILAAVLIVTATVINYVQNVGGYPAVGAWPEQEDMDDDTGPDLAIKIITGSIPTGQWEFKINAEDPNKIDEGWRDNLDKWINPDKPLDAAYVLILSSEYIKEGNYPVKFSVSLRHKETGHVYFSDAHVTVSD